MPRKMRVEYPGAMYHVMSRGDQRDDIFFDDVDRYDFIKTLEDLLKSHGFSAIGRHRFSAPAFSAPAFCRLHSFIS